MESSDGYKGRVLDSCMESSDGYKGRVLDSCMEPETVQFHHYIKTGNIRYK
jgi:hypothetical protein